MNKTVLTLLIALAVISAKAQTETNNKEKIDSIYIVEVEDNHEPYKVLHAEPLYIDLIRDLGARKGEKEWNIGILI